MKNTCTPPCATNCIYKVERDLHFPKGSKSKTGQSDVGTESLGIIINLSHWKSHHYILNFNWIILSHNNMQLTCDCQNMFYTVRQIPSSHFYWIDNWGFLNWNPGSLAKYLDVEVILISEFVTSEIRVNSTQICLKLSLFLNSWIQK